MQVDFPTSSAISSIGLSGNDITIVFQSSEKVYNFTTETPEIVESFLENPQGSVGQTYRKWVAEDVIHAVELAAV
jgi:hypothetical protein